MMEVNPQTKMATGLMKDLEITIQKIGMVQVEAPGTIPFRLM